MYTKGATSLNTKATMLEKHSVFFSLYVTAPLLDNN